MNTARSSICTASIVAFACLLAACSKSPQSIENLPELPADLAKDLVTARTAPVYMTGPLVKEGKPRPAEPTSPAPLVPPRACTTTFEGYVTFPITVCHLPPFHDL